MCSIAVEMFLVDCDRLISRDSLFPGQVAEVELHPIVISRRLQVLKACSKETHDRVNIEVGRLSRLSRLLI